jgi:spore maturation protein SpmB
MATERIDPRGQPGISQCKTILTVYAIILLLLVIVKLLNFLHITDMLGRVLRPVLHMMGISKDAAPVTIIGMTMGIGYGGGLIIHEARSGRLSKRDIFFSLSFMGLMHSMIEDTLRMIFLGGHISGVLFLRFIFAMIVIFIMVRLMRNMTDRSFNRYFFRGETIRQ